jgi:hypothetical protein
MVTAMSPLITNLAFPVALQSGTETNRILLQLNNSEAEAVLAIVTKHNTKAAITDSDWRQLFSTEPYVRLKKREASIQRDFTDSDFEKFVLSPELAAKAPQLGRTLEEWKKADLTASARRVLAYLPEKAMIHAKVFPVIKPKTNSFVFETETDPTIFLYLDPEEPAAKFENTVAHELHHIGFSSVSSLSNAKLNNLSPNVKAAVDWMSAFGEGFAMLAAAGGPDVHPHTVSSPEERARWDHDIANFNQDVNTLDKFFLDVINKRLSPGAIDEQASKFFGVQGPWYTVGYKMAVVVERGYGRPKLIECMIDPRELLTGYNAAARELNRTHREQLALWSPKLLEAIGNQS